jgi:hypothetical protein
MFDIGIEVITLPRAGRFSARVARSDKLLIASSRQPFCDAALALRASGVDPSAKMTMRARGLRHRCLALDGRNHSQDLRHHGVDHRRRPSRQPMRPLPPTGRNAHRHRDRVTPAGNGSPPVARQLFFDADCSLPRPSDGPRQHAPQRREAGGANAEGLI